MEKKRYNVVSENRYLSGSYSDYNEAKEVKKNFEDSSHFINIIDTEKYKTLVKKYRQLKKQFHNFLQIDEYKFKVYIKIGRYNFRAYPSIDLILVSNKESPIEFVDCYDKELPVGEPKWGISKIYFSTWGGCEVENTIYEANLFHKLLNWIYMIAKDYDGLTGGDGGGEWGVWLEKTKDFMYYIRFSYFS